MTMLKRVNRHSNENIMASVVTRVTRLVMMSMKVPVTARWAPTTSLFRRLINSPVLV